MCPRGALQGGLLVNTVASAAAAAARQTNPLPFTRLSDTTTTDDCGEEVVEGTPWRSAITSHVWVDSALVFTTASNQVWYLTPLGRARRICALEAPVRDRRCVRVSCAHTPWVVLVECTLSFCLTLEAFRSIIV